ncbi:hypothetical protein FKM82_002240 [Ascaphus truei]
MLITELHKMKKFTESHPPPHSSLSQPSKRHSAPYQHLHSPGPRDLKQESNIMFEPFVLGRERHPLQR